MAGRGSAVGTNETFEPRGSGKFPLWPGLRSDAGRPRFGGGRQPSSILRSGGRFSMMASMAKNPVTVDNSKSVISFW